MSDVDLAWTGGPTYSLPTWETFATAEYPTCGICLDAECRTCDVSVADHVQKPSIVLQETQYCDWITIDVVHFLSSDI